MHQFVGEEHTAVPQPSCRQRLAKQREVELHVNKPVPTQSQRKTLERIPLKAKMITVDN